MDDEDLERSLRATLNLLHAIEPNLTISAEGPDQSEVFGKAEVVRKRTERWIAVQLRSSLIASADSSPDTGNPASSSRARSVRKAFNTISKNKVVRMLVAFALAALATLLGIEGFSS